jgi:nucleoid-associated protein YgaU
MKCYACDRDAVHECRRCGRLYCADHGDELCAECLRPASALPSYVLYRGSLLALLVGTAVALWLLLKPPEKATESVPSIISSTAVATPTARTSPVTPLPVTPRAGTPEGTPEGTPQGTPEGTPEGTPQATPRTTATPGVTEYTVQEGDSLFGIAERFAPSGESITNFARRIAERNGLSPEDPLLQPGQKLIIPP